MILFNQRLTSNLFLLLHPHPSPHQPPTRPLVVPGGLVSLLPLEFPVAPTPQGLELGCRVEKLLAALLVRYQLFQCILESWYCPVVRRPREDVGSSVPTS